MKNCNQISLFIVLIALLFSGPAKAQQVEPPVSLSESAGAASEQMDPTGEKLDALLLKIEQQQDELNLVKRDAAEQKVQAAQMKQALADAGAEQQILAERLGNTETVDDEMKLHMYGFMDLNFTKTWAAYKDSAIFATQPRRSTFYQNNVNLFFHSKMTSSLETLVEVRFTYQPNGNMNYTPDRLYVAGVLSPQDKPPYNVTDTTVDEAYAGEVNLGGVMIERAQFDWKPKDWFNFRAGRFLTPFGIWNENHGSPVILATTRPFIISNQYVPTAQTGIMAFGRAFPTDMLGIEYALTLSNGRGPFSEFYDIDENKAVGLRAKLRWTGNDWFVTLGTYGYMGKYTEAEQNIAVYMNYNGTTVAWQDLRYDESVDHPYSVRERVTNKYRELILSTDLEVSYKGLQLFAEYVARKVDYLVPTDEDPNLPFLIGANPTIESVRANFIGQAAYVMLAYELPLKKYIGDIRITPYVGYDYLRPNDSRKYDRQSMIQFGLNVKPSPYVTPKSSATLVVPYDELFLGGNLWYWTNAIAVSF